MDAELIERWNRKVHRNDTVYIVGDFIFRCHRPPEEYFDLRKGKKHLILGNHDKYWLKKVEVEKHLEPVSPILQRNAGGTRQNRGFCLCVRNSLSGGCP